MIPLKITLHNFLSYADPRPLDFSRFDLAVFLGENGAGKSSILEALTWAVWEKTRASSSDDLIHQGAENMWVDFVFAHEGQTFRIFRRRDKKKQGTTFLEFQIKEGKSNLLETSSWKTISESTLRATQEKIVKTLKLPYEIFVNTSYLRQGRADEFTIKTPAERKEILGEILGLEDWQRLEEKTKEKLKNLENIKDVLGFQLAELKNQLGQEKTLAREFEISKKQKEDAQKILQKQEVEFKKLESQKKEKELAEEKILSFRERLQEIVGEIKNLQSERKESSQEIANYESVLKDKKEIEKNIQKLEDCQKKLSQLEQKRETYQKLREKLLILSQHDQELINKISKIKKISTCPTCLRPLSQKEAEEIIFSLTKDKKSFQTEVFKIKTEVQKLSYSPFLEQKIKTEIQKLKIFEEKVKSLAVAEESLKNLKKLQTKISQNIKNKLAHREQIIAAGKLLKSKIQKLAPIISRWEKLTEKIESCRQELLLLEGKFGAKGQALKELEKQKVNFAQKEAKLKNAHKEMAILEELVEAFSKKGIQAMLIEQAIPAIEENANVILKKASDDKLSLKFITQRSKKTAAEETIETLEIKITDTSGERDYEMFSGGEAFRINFAVRVALAKFLASRAGIHLKFLAMDEGFGTLDAAGREDLIKTINSIQKDFAKIIVITHIQELKDLFLTQIMITKTDQGSQIEITG